MWILGALKNGYRHLDTAHDYGTEGVVGRAVQDSGLAREEVWVTTKLPYVLICSRAGSQLNYSLDYTTMQRYLIHTRTP